MRFFDRYLKGDAVPDDPAFRVQDNLGRWRTEPAWPPADAERFTMSLRPGEYTDRPDNVAENGGGLSGTPGNGTWTVSQPLPYQVHLSGVAKVTLDVAVTGPRTTTVALLYDIGPDGRATLITRGAYAVKASGPVSFELYPQDWRLLAGHRIGLLVSGSDLSLYYPPHSGLPAQLRGGSVSMPALRGLRTFESTAVGRPSTAMKARPAPFAVPAATIAAAEQQVALPPQQG